MSGRGTIKAGTFGGREYRRRAQATTAVNVEREKIIKKRMKGDLMKSVKIKEGFRPDFQSFPTSELITERPDNIIQRASNVNLRAPLGRGGSQVQGDLARARDIQAIVNTMPLRINASAYQKIREEQAEEEFGAELDDALNDEFGPDGGDMDIGDFAEDQIAEAPQAGAELENEDQLGQGEAEYGADLAQYDDTEMPDWIDEFQVDEGFLGDDLDGLANDLIDMGVGDNLGTEGGDNDMDELSNQLADQTLSEGVHRMPSGSLMSNDEMPRPSLVEELDARKSARQNRGLSVPPGELPPSQGGSMWRGLGPTQQEVKYPSDNYKRDKKGNIKYSGVATLQGNFAPVPTDEAKARQMGRIMDLRPGYIGKDVSANQPDLKNALKEGKNFEGGASSKKKPGLPPDVPKSNRPIIAESGNQLFGPVIHPKTRKPVRQMMPGDKVDKGKKNDKGKMVGGDKNDATFKKYKSGKNASGPILDEPKSLGNVGRKKAPEETWGMDQKGMSRNPDDEDYSAPVGGAFEGARLVGKDAGKRATRKREAITKRALFVKGKREDDPDWLPQGYGSGFNYGSGYADWDKGKKGADKSKLAGLRSNDKEYSYDISGVVQNSAVGETDGPDTSGVTDAEMDLLTQYKPNDSVPAFPGAESIFAPRGTIGQGGISNPPMADLKATAGPQLGPKGRPGTFFKKYAQPSKILKPRVSGTRSYEDRYRDLGGREDQRAQAIASMTYDEISTLVGSGDFAMMGRNLTAETPIMKTLDVDGNVQYSEDPNPMNTMTDYQRAGSEAFFGQMERFPDGGMEDTAKREKYIDPYEGMYDVEGKKRSEEDRKKYLNWKPGDGQSVRRKPRSDLLGRV